jgi:hypothetical protein
MRRLAWILLSLLVLGGLSLLVLGGSGCTMAPRYVRPEPAVPPAWPAGAACPPPRSWIRSSSSRMRACGRCSPSLCRTTWTCAWPR